MEGKVRPRILFCVAFVQPQRQLQMSGYMERQKGRCDAVPAAIHKVLGWRSGQSRGPQQHTTGQRGLWDYRDTTVTYPFVQVTGRVMYDVPGKCAFLQALIVLFTVGSSRIGFGFGDKKQKQKRENGILGVVVT